MLVFLYCLIKYKYRLITDLPKIGVFWETIIFNKSDSYKKCLGIIKNKLDN